MGHQNSQNWVKRIQRKTVPRLPKLCSSEQQVQWQQRKIDKSQAVAGGTAEAGEKVAKKGGWLSKFNLPKPKLPSIPRPSMPKMPKFRLPKLKLPSLRLPPPESSPAESKSDSSQSGLKPVNGAKPLPRTHGPTTLTLDSGGRPLSKAERKRMKRIQDDQRVPRRAA